MEKLCGVEQVRAAWDGCVACGGLGKKDLYEGRWHLVGGGGPMADAVGPSKT